MHNIEIAKQIIALKDADLRLRDQLIQSGHLFDGYHAEMEALHLSNAHALEGIIDQIGYPTIALVGPEANDAAWLIIQHSISRPDFMRKCQLMLQSAVAENQANHIHLAYLTDRIAVLSGEPQLYGTQYDWDINGELNPQAYDHLPTVDLRRKDLGLNTVSEQTAIMRQRATNENESAPADYHHRQAKMNKWRQSVGWIG